jgi:tRNA/tmRNA/rRNA uracil-C5-methylase (TrmA/RlmC/RlmD family)
MQFDLANRVIVQNTEEGETVYDPFAGLGTVPMCAVQNKRRAIAVELSAAYFADSLMYVRGAAEKVATPTLFDLMEAEEEPDELEATL